VEMVVVIAVIVILLALVVPAATQMWNQRAVSDAENAISGLLMTTRAKAMQGDMGEMGLFFFVDKSGVQQVATIAKSPIDPDRPAPDPTAAPDTVEGQIAKWRQKDFWRDIYTIIGQPRAMPSSMRVIPRKAMQWPPSAKQQPDRPSPQLLRCDLQHSGRVFRY
jgi:type II secretory pathway pseudopilin PulG